MDEDYLMRWMNSENGGKYCNWNNYFIDITDQMASSMDQT